MAEELPRVGVDPTHFVSFSGELVHAMWNTCLPRTHARKSEGFCTGALERLVLTVESSSPTPTPECREAGKVVCCVGEEISLVGSTSLAHPAQKMWAYILALSLLCMASHLQVLVLMLLNREDWMGAP